MTYAIGISQHQPIFAEGCCFKTCTETLMSLVEKVRAFFASIFQMVFCCFSSGPSPILPERVSPNPPANHQVLGSIPPVIPESPPQGNLEQPALPINAVAVQDVQGNPPPAQNHDNQQGQGNLEQPALPANAAAVQEVQENLPLVGDQLELEVIPEWFFESGDEIEIDGSVENQSGVSGSARDSDIDDDDDGIEEVEKHLHTSTPEDDEEEVDSDNYLFDATDLEDIECALKTPRAGQGSTAGSSGLGLIRNLQNASLSSTQTRCLPPPLTAQERAEFQAKIRAYEEDSDEKDTGVVQSNSETEADFWAAGQRARSQTEIDLYDDESDEKEMGPVQSTGPIALPEKRVGFLAAFELAFAVFENTFSEANTEMYLRNGIAKAKHCADFETLRGQFLEQSLNITCSSIAQPRKVWIDNFKVEFGKKEEARCIVLSNGNFSVSHAICILPFEEDQLYLGLFSPNATPATFQSFNSFEALKDALPKSGRYHAYEIVHAAEEAHSLLDELD